MAKNLLSSVEVFADLDGSEIEIMEKSAQEMVFPADSVIFKQGEQGDKMYLIVYGIVEIWKSEGQEIKGSRLARLKQGEIFGEMALFDKEPRSASAVTSLTKEAKMLVWDDKDLQKLIQAQPVFGTKILNNFLKSPLLELYLLFGAMSIIVHSDLSFDPSIVAYS